MASTQKYVIEDGGRIYRQTITEQEIDIQTDIMTRFAKEQTVKISNLYHSAVISPKLIGNVNMAMCGKIVTFTLLLGTFPLKARFTVDNGALVPDFTSEGTPMTLEWVPPSDMSIYFLVVMTPDSCNAAEQYVVARDMSGRYYRIPTTNMHDNCQLCTGKYDGRGASYADALAKAINQFINSDWGAHLPGTKEQLSASKSLFRFKPLEPEGFQQLEIRDGRHWTELCTKVSASVINQYLTP